MEKVKNPIIIKYGKTGRDELMLLHQIAAKSRDGVIVEIGSWTGQSTIALAKGSKEGNNLKVYAIDPHTGEGIRPVGKPELKEMGGSTLKTFLQNIKREKVDDIIIPLLKKSEEAIKEFDKPIAFLFIDGCHKYENIKRDFELYYPLLIKGGLIAFHDCKDIGPKQVIEEFILNSNRFENVGIVDKITYATKTEERR